MVITAMSLVTIQSLQSQVVTIFDGVSVVKTVFMMKHMFRLHAKFISISYVN